MPNIMQDDYRKKRKFNVQECLAATKKLWWKEPEFLRFPPKHMEKYYKITDKDTGIYLDFGTGAIHFCKEIPNTNPKRYFYTNSGMFTARTMVMKPMYNMTDEQGKAVTALRLSQQMYNNVYVGERACFAKKVKANGARDTPMEVFFSFVASVFHCGPEILDFWAYNDEVRQMGYRATLLIERIYTGHDWCDAENIVEGKPWGSKWSKEFQKEFHNASTPLAVRIMHYLNLGHPDLTNNFGFYANGQFMLFDWEGANVHIQDERADASNQVEEKESRQLQSAQSNQQLDTVAHGRYLMTRTAHLPPRVVDARKPWRPRRKPADPWDSDFEEEDAKKDENGSAMDAEMI